MKRTGILPLLLLALMLGACTPKKSEPRFETLALDTLVHAGAAQYDIQYRFLSLEEADRSPALQAIEEADIAYFFELEGFTGTAREAMRTAVEQLADGSMLPGDEAARYSYSVEATAARVDTLLVYTITRSGYLGGPHDLYDTTTHTYSLEGGYELTLGDLFTPQQQERLAGLIRARLRAQYHVSDDEGLFPRLHPPVRELPAHRRGHPLPLRPLRNRRQCAGRHRGAGQPRRARTALTRRAPTSSRRRPAPELRRLLKSGTRHPAPDHRQPTAPTSRRFPKPDAL